MTFLGLEQPVAYGREQVFDPTTAQMVLNANRDYINAVYRDYQQAMADMKEFNKEYGNFLSPFARDMERYNQIVGGIQNGIEDLYNRGIDPLRSSEGRAYVTRMINSVNPAELAAMKSNAKLGYAYLDAMQALRKAGKYSQAQEDFDIALNGETAFNDFATGNGSGGFNTWGRTSPIEATTLRDLTYDSYKGRTARDLTGEDFKNDPRLRNYAYDPRYQYSGYLDSDLMKVAPGASASLAADPRAAFFRDQARQKVIASGKEPTAEAVEAQFQRDIADANTWALIDPTKRADDFAKLDLEHQYRMDEIAEAGKHKGGGSGDKDDGPDDPYSIVISNAARSKLQSLEGAMGKYSEEKIKALMIKDPYERQKAIDRLDGKAMKKWLAQKVNGTSRFKRIMEAQYGNDGVLELNNLLSSRAVNGNIGLDASQILKMAGFEADDDGWFKINEGSTKVVSPHQIFKNILKYESGNGFVITDVKGGKTTRDDIIKQLDDIENSDYLWTNATTKERVNRASAVKPQTVSDTGGYIIAPNDAGVPTLYMKTAIKQSASFGSPGSWLPKGKHGGFWVEVPLHQRPDGTISLESVPVVHGQDVQQRKEYGDAVTTHASDDLRY